MNPPSLFAPLPEDRSRVDEDATLRRRLRAPSVKVYLLFLIPIALDGFTQLFGLRMSNWWLRTLTGAIFGGASVWLAYPYLQEAMNDVIQVELSPRNR